MTARRAAPVAAALCALVAGPAAAHGSLPGGSGFLAGALHPFVAVEHLLLLLSLGLLSGRLPPQRRALGFAAVGLGLLVGLTLGEAGLAGSAAPSAILALALAGGLLLASGLLLPSAVPALAALSGVAVGIDTDVARAVAPALGVIVGAYLIVLDAAALSALAKSLPFIVAVRVAGSWIAAVALMLLALALSLRGSVA